MSKSNIRHQNMLEWMESTDLKVPEHLRRELSAIDAPYEMPNLKIFAARFAESLELFRVRFKKAGYKRLYSDLCGRRGDKVFNLYMDSQERVFEKYYTKEPDAGEKLGMSFDWWGTSVRQVSELDEPKLYRCLFKAYDVLNIKPENLVVSLVESDLIAASGYHYSGKDQIMATTALVKTLSDDKLTGFLLHELKHVMSDRIKHTHYTRNRKANHQIEFISDDEPCLRGYKEEFIEALKIAHKHDHDRHPYLKAIKQCVVAEIEDFLPKSPVQRRLIAGYEAGYVSGEYSSSNTHPALTVRVARMRRKNYGKAASSFSVMQQDSDITR
jgi:hypothetical protein